MAIRIETKDRVEEFGVTKIPTRKSKCLYRMRGNMLEPLAYFRSDEDAEIFDKILDFIFDLFSANAQK